MSLDEMKSIIDQMPESKEKERAEQGYESLKTFEVMSDAFVEMLEKE